MTRCDALYRVSLQGWGRGTGDSLVLLTPHPLQNLAEGFLSPLHPFSNAPGWLSGAAQGWSLQSCFPKKPGGQEAAPSAMGLSEEQMTGSRLIAFGKVLLTTRRQSGSDPTPGRGGRGGRAGEELGRQAVLSPPSTVMVTVT